MLHLQQVFLNKTISTIVIYDDGSSISLITHNLVAMLNLPYFERWETVTFAGHHPETMLTRNYALKVTQNDGKTKMIRCLGLEHITDDVPKLNVDAAYDIFPMVPYDFWQGGVIDL